MRSLSVFVALMLAVRSTVALPVKHQDVHNGVPTTLPGLPGTADVVSSTRFAGALHSRGPTKDGNTRSSKPPLHIQAAQHWLAGREAFAQADALHRASHNSDPDPARDERIHKLYKDSERSYKLAKQTADRSMQHSVQQAAVAATAAQVGAAAGSASNSGHDKPVGTLRKMSASEGPHRDGQPSAHKQWHASGSGRP